MRMNPMLPRFFLAAVVSLLSACAMSPDTSSASAAPAAKATTPPQAPTLLAYHWDLSDARDAGGAAQQEWTPPSSTTVRFSFSNQRLTISGLCNHLGAGYSLNADSIRIAPVVGTMMACSKPGLMEYEQALAKRLPHATAWHIAQHPTGPQLTLHFDDGAQWTLTGTPTNETRFGGPGETRFLEVASQRIPCSHPGMPHMQCLKVREIQYNAEGIKTGHGEWQAFYSDIEGYTHHPGIRNVLRIKRYERSPVPADASRYVYVLDMVVESAKE